MTAIHLLRCKAEPLPQGDAFSEEMSAVDVLIKSFLARPTASVRRNSTWHIGNTVESKAGWITFALGREAVLLAPQFDEKLREFKEVEQAHAPFTVGVFDPRDQTIGILIRPGVSLNAREVAAKIEALLESAGVARRANRQVRVDFIPDPTGFIESIRSAHRITRFEFSFTLPNPPDDNKYIQRPLKEFAAKAGAVEGKAAFKGDNLDKDEIEEVSIAVAASGDDATANIQSSPRAPIVRKRLSVNALREAIESTELTGKIGGIGAAIHQAMRRAYSNLRKPPENVSE
ncbi:MULTISPECIES: hypothetical protein [unclassified Novosphingobium]|uniref:hypothetical protein n=1 Tax=unclassified Novosphingobium TaxID=2644732 RepID=UPI0025EC4B7C|nr:MULTISPECIES: hypothetical protein [unclassified Novosphingobium]HQV03844.1 hypothetical protein [Novosphingobium sp.]